MVILQLLISKKLISRKIWVEKNSAISTLSFKQSRFYVKLCELQNVVSRKIWIDKICFLAMNRAFDVSANPGIKLGILFLP